MFIIRYFCSQNGVAEDSSLVRCDPPCLGERLPAFRIIEYQQLRNTALFLLWIFFLDCRSLKMKALKSVETSGNIRPETKLYTLEELNILTQFLCTSQYILMLLVI